MLRDEALGRAAAVLERAEDVALVCHVNPDADALGSMLGLAVFLAGRGKRVAATWPNEPWEPPPWLDALPGKEHLVEPSRIPKDAAVLVTLDAADVGRLGGLGHLVQKAAASICIDHHRTNEGFGSIDLVDPDASATAEIVFRLIERMDGKLDPGVAMCLYAGLVTDTGRFQYESATPEVLRIAATLRERPFDHARLAQALFEDTSLGALRVMGTALTRATLLPDAGLVWTWLRRADFAAAGVSIHETDGLIDLIRSAREADVVAVLKEQRDRGYKVSLRSRGGTDVAAVSAALGGGGHRLAAGYSSKAELDATVEALVRELSRVRFEGGAGGGAETDEGETSPAPAAPG